MLCLMYIHNFCDTRIRKSAIISWSVVSDLSLYLYGTRPFELERNLKHVRSAYWTRCMDIAFPVYSATDENLNDFVLISRGVCACWWKMCYRKQQYS